jgi:hypothetical protein
MTPRTLMGPSDTLDFWVVSEADDSAAAVWAALRSGWLWADPRDARDACAEGQILVRVTVRIERAERADD